MPLDVYNASLYTITFDDNDWQCIAPKFGGSRCGSKWPAAEDKAEIHSLMNLARSSEYEQAAAALAKVVRLRICTFAHRKYFEQSAYSTVWEDVANRYIDEFMRLYRSSGLLTPPMTPPGRSQTYSASPQAGPATPSRYQLRSLGPAPPVQTFTPVQQRLRIPTNAVLKDDLVPDEPQWGWVYVLVWPSQPGFLKIGYTGNSVEGRLSDWSDHHSGIEILYQMEVPYPQRVEALIHADLRHVRYEVTFCSYCHGHRHNEWFKISHASAIRTLESWRSVINREPLYEYGGLSRWWYDALEYDFNDYDAAYLNSILDESDRLAAEKARVEEQARREQARRQEQARQEQARQEQLRREQARQEQARQEQVRQEQVRLEQARQEQARLEQARLEEARQEQARQEQARLEEARQEQARQEQPRQEQPRRERQAASTGQLRGLRERLRQMEATFKAPRQAEQTRQAEVAEQQRQVEQDRRTQSAGQAQQARLAEEARQTKLIQETQQAEIAEQVRKVQLVEQAQPARIVAGGIQQVRAAEEDEMLNKNQQSPSIKNAAQPAASALRVSGIEETVGTNSSDQAHVVVPDALQPIAIVRQSTNSTADEASRDEVISPSEPISARPTDVPAAQRESTGLPTPVSSPQRQPRAVKSDNFTFRFSSPIIAAASCELALPHRSKLPEATKDESEEQTTSGKAISTAPSPSAEKITPATPVKIKVSLPPTPPETPLYRKSAPEGNGSGPEALAVHQGEPSRPTTPVPPLPKADKDPFAGSTMNQLAKTAATTTTTTTAQASEFVLAVPSVVVP